MVDYDFMVHINKWKNDKSISSRDISKFNNWKSQHIDTKFF